MAVKDFFQGAAKTALAIFLALLGLVIVIGLFNSAKEHWAARHAKPYEEIQVWQKDLSSTLGMTVSLKTKLVSGTLYGRLEALGSPPFLTDPASFNKNSGRDFVIQLVDKDGFKMWEKSIPLSEMSQIVGSQQVVIGYAADISEVMLVERYAAVEGWNVLWTFDTRALGTNTGRASEPVLDHCQPSLSKTERLKRLSQHGAVRETGLDEYSAGAHRVVLSYGAVMACH